MKLVALCLALTACGWIKNPTGSSGSSMSKIEYYYVAPLPAGQVPQDNPIDHMQTRFGAETNVVVLYYDDSRTCEHYEELDELAVYDLQTKTNGPNELSCANEQPHDSSTDVPYTSTAGRGTLSKPMTDSTWAGSAGGGCGTFATAMCNRVLKLTPADQAVTKDEWNGIATAIKQTDGGASSWENRVHYYKDMGGYCGHINQFDGDLIDYQYIAQHIDNCDMKMMFQRNGADGKGIDGHVETVTAIDYMNKTITTNSWGFQGTITGGTSGNFNHSRDGAGLAFHQPDGSKLWPASSTTVWLETVCPCNQFGDAASFLETATL